MTVYKSILAIDNTKVTSGFEKSVVYNPRFTPILFVSKTVTDLTKECAWFAGE